MAGIYIHIPYCKQACSYCDFYFTTNPESKPGFVLALICEIEKQKAFFRSGTTIETIYFGGGTPSLLVKDELKKILDAVYTNFSVAVNPEITLEANPDNLTADYLNDLKACGINRLSIGLQSFKDEELSRLKRTHTAADNMQVVALAQAAGFHNISVDLIYGTPFSDETEWNNYVDKVIALNVQHVSCYQLTVEEKTMLHHEIKTGKTPVPDDERTEKQFLLLIEKMKNAGFDHYEVSNFGKKGFYSRHNSAYWKDVPYLGLGPSAHGYNGVTRFSNVANVHQYIKALSGNTSWFQVEVLSEKEQYNDLVLTGLRSVFGVDLPVMERKLNQSFVNYFQRKVQPFLEAGSVIKEGYTYRLEEKSFLFADRISAELFYI